jgi:hypothetical protein
MKSLCRGPDKKCRFVKCKFEWPGVTGRRNCALAGAWAQRQRSFTVAILLPDFCDL